MLTLTLRSVSFYVEAKATHLSFSVMKGIYIKVSQRKKHEGNTLHLQYKWNLSLCWGWVAGSGLCSPGQRWCPTAGLGMALHWSGALPYRLCALFEGQDIGKSHESPALSALRSLFTKYEVRKFLILSPSLSMPSPSCGYKWGTGSWCRNTSLIALVRITIHPQVLPAENNTRTSNGEK